MLGERFDEQKAVFRNGRAYARDDLGVVDRVADSVRAFFARRQTDLDRDDLVRRCGVVGSDRLNSPRQEADREAVGVEVAPLELPAQRPVGRIKDEAPPENCLSLIPAILVVAKCEAAIDEAAVGNRGPQALADTTVAPPLGGPGWCQRFPQAPVRGERRQQARRRGLGRQRRHVLDDPGADQRLL